MASPYETESGYNMSREKISFVYMGQDDPKKSTMKKLEKQGLARRVDMRMCKRSLMITPYAERYLLPSDDVLYRIKGICVIDGSWNRITSIRDLRTRNERLIPLVVPGNPVNFGKPGKLSSVEAVASALYIMGHRDSASLIMSGFNWGPPFIEMNHLLLDDYAECKTQEDVLAVQESYF